MRQGRRKSHLWPIFIIALMMGGNAFSLNLIAQGEEPSPPGGFIVHTCTYDQENDSIAFQGSLVGSDGNPIPPENYTVDIGIVGSEETLSQDAIQTESLPERQPLQIMLVLDVTETVPIPRIVSTLNAQLLQQLQPDDEIVLVSFSSEISSSQPYRNKDLFFSEQLENLRPQFGDNRMYDAIRDAVIYPANSQNKRRVVLVVTDSSPREDETPPFDEIIDDATTAKVPIFAIGFYTTDTPDVPGLTRLANATDGYVWINEENADVEAIERAFAAVVNDFNRALNSEIRIAADLQGLDPDITTQVTFEIRVDLADDPTLTDTITCGSIDRFKSTIAFMDEDLNNITVTGRIDIGVDVDSRLDEDERQIYFYRNGEIVQNSADDIYVFDASVIQPGDYTIRAQLRDSADNELADTETELRIFAQQLIEMSGEQTETGSLRLEALISQDIELPPVFFNVALARNPGNTVLLLDEGVTFNGNIAVTEIQNFREIVTSLPLNIRDNSLIQITAFVPNPEDGQPLLATSNILQLDLTPLPTPIPPTPIPTPVPEPPFPIQNTPPQLINQVILPGLIIFFLSLNVLLFRQGRRERVKRIIRNPDRHELSDQLMSLTVHNEGVRQTHRLTKKTVFIGRGPGNDINLGGDPDISRNHGVVMWRRNAWYYTNRKRRARARIDGKWYRGFALRKLEPITSIEIRGVQIIFHASSQRDVSEFIITNI